MYQKVENRALFKKSTAARDKLMEMGGVQQGLGSMQRPPMPGGPSGIMASSPDLMQAAMRKAPVLPAQQAMSAPAAAPAAPAAPAPMPLPPSQPMPNIAGIAPVPTNQAPRPPAKQPVKKMNEGGFLDSVLDYKGPVSNMTLREKFASPMEATNKAVQGMTMPFMPFTRSIEFARKAMTSGDPKKMGVPESELEKFGEREKEMENDPEKAGKNFVNENVPEDQRTGDLKKDLKKAAANSGLSEIPENATVDQLNQAIAGAKLGAAIAGSYVNPNTGQELRPTAGARIGQAVAEGLAVKRDTAQKREDYAQKMKLAQVKAAGKSTSNKLPPNMKSMIEIFKERAKTEDLDEVAKDFNEYFGDNTGDQIMTYLKTGMSGGGEQTQTETASIEVGRTATGKDGQKLVWDGTAWQTQK